MIEFSGVSYAYQTHGGAIGALRGVDAHLDRGEVLAVLGPNGSGKSTLAQLANGLLLPSSGTVRVDDLDTHDPRSVWTVRSRVGMVFQDPDNQIVGTVVEEDVAFGPENLGVPRDEIRRRVDAALAAVGLAGLERREPHLLSGGQKQRLAIAGALAMEPAYLVFDEPTALLDPRGRADVLDIVRSLAVSGTGILHITHHLADISGADRVLVLAGGEVAFSGSPAALFEDPGLLPGLGLSLPPAWRLAEELRSRGVAVPASAADAESITGALWP